MHLHLFIFVFGCNIQVISLQVKRVNILIWLKWKLYRISECSIRWDYVGLGGGGVLEVLTNI